MTAPPARVVESGFSFAIMKPRMLVRKDVRNV